MHVVVADIGPTPGAALVDYEGKLVLVLDSSTPPPLAAALRRLLERVDGKVPDGG